jgi:hypothetical protein
MERDSGQAADGDRKEPRRTRRKTVGLLVFLLALIAVAYALFRPRPVAEPPMAGTPKAKETASSAQPASQRPPQDGGPANRVPQTGEVSFSANHKHRLRDCHGVLTFSRRSVRYVARDSDDSFTFPIADVTPHENGIEARGRRWHFEIRGRDAGKIFKDWKAGRLPIRKN